MKIEKRRVVKRDNAADPGLECWWEVPLRDKEEQQTDLNVVFFPQISTFSIVDFFPLKS